MDATEGVRYLEKSRDAQLDAARQARSAASDRLIKLNSPGIFGRLYDAGAPAEFKLARVQFQAANWWGGSITHLYMRGEQAFQETSTETSVFVIFVGAFEKAIAPGLIVYIRESDSAGPVILQRTFALRHSCRSAAHSAANSHSARPSRNRIHRDHDAGRAPPRAGRNW